MYRLFNPVVNLKTGISSFLSYVGTSVGVEWVELPFNEG